MNTKHCQKCGKSFLPKRSTAKFCSSSCRSGYHQRGNQIDEDLRTIREALGRISTTSFKMPDLIRRQHLDDLHAVFLYMDKIEDVATKSYINNLKSKRGA